MAKPLKAKGDKKDGIIYRNPEHVKAYLRSRLVHFKNVWSEMARKLGMNPSRLSGIMHDRIPLTQETLDKINVVLRCDLKLEPPSVERAVLKAADDFAAEKTGTPNLAKIMAVAEAAYELTDDEQELLVKLLEFGMSEIPDGIRGVVMKLGELKLLKDVLK